MKTNTISSAILSNGQLNVNLIQKEVKQEISEDALYKAEDKMKKKVVHTSKNYEEFRQYVACSQLQTIPSSKFHELFTSTSTNSTSYLSINQSKQHHSTNTKRKHKNKMKEKKNLSSLTSKEKDLLAKENFLSLKPSNAMKFQKNWHMYCPTIEDKANYLIRTKVNAKNAPSVNEITNQFIFTSKEAISVFSVELDCITMSYIIESLEYLLLQYKNTNDTIFNSKSIVEYIHEWIIALTKCGRFSINVIFLDEKCKKILSVLFDEICCRMDDHDFDELKKEYGIL